MEIPIDRLDAATLRRLIEECVTRDGTDLVDVNRKVEQVMAALRSGKAVLTWDAETATPNVMPVSGLRG